MKYNIRVMITAAKTFKETLASQTFRLYTMPQTNNCDFAAEVGS